LRLHVQEERRLFYVGLTRAKHYLWLSNAQDTGSKVTRKRSRFVYEALGTSRGNQVRTQGAAVERLQRMAPVMASEPLELPPIPQDRTLSLSYYRIRDYLDCPKKYQFAHVLRLPVASDPAVMYGRAIHGAISTLLQARQEGKDLGLEAVQDHFRGLWEPVGFLSSQHERARFQAGLVTLENFHRREQSVAPPAMVEQSFSIRLEHTRLTGRFDRVDQLPTILTDYKCAEVESQAKADELTDASLQLALYSLAYFASGPERKLPTEVRLHFLDSDLIGRAQPTDGHLAEANQKIARAAAGIRARNYEAAPVFGACQRCPYRPICPSAFV
jgi:DNA helicase-2/ATP-dependent DNA helicase PcrA